MANTKAAPTAPQHGPRPKVGAWVMELSQAGDSMELAATLLHKVRDDPNATKTDRYHFYRVLAQQSFLWYLGALRGKPLSSAEVYQASAEALREAKAKKAVKTAKPNP